MPPNVLLIVMDSVRAVNTSLHGYHRETTPFLEEFAEQAVKFESAYAPAEWSLPSHVSMFTGYHAAEHGVSGEHSKMETGHSFFEDLNNEGYATGLFTENPYLAQLDTGLESGFETVRSPANEVKGPKPTEYSGQPKEYLLEAIRSGTPVRSIFRGMIGKVGWDRPDLVPNPFLDWGTGISYDDIYVDHFLTWQDSSSEPWAACINLMDAHYPYKPIPSHNKWDDGSGKSAQKSLSSPILDFYLGKKDWSVLDDIENLYDGAIHQVDSTIQKIISTLDSRNDLNNTLVVITSDHGECFGERCPFRDVRLVGHNVGALEENLHVPLIVKPVEGREEESVSEPVSLTALSAMIYATTTGSAKLLAELSEEPIFATTTGFWPSRLDKLRENKISTIPYEGEMHVRYTKCGKYNKKEILWKDRYAAFVDGERLSESNKELLRNEIHNMKEIDIVREDYSSINKSTEKRLEELGYR